MKKQSKTAQSAPQNEPINKEFHELDKRVLLIEKQFSWFLRGAGILILAVCGYFGLTTWFTIPSAIETKFADKGVTTLINEISNAHQNVTVKLEPEMRRQVEQAKTAFQGLESGEISFSEDKKHFTSVKQKDGTMHLVATRTVKFKRPFDSQPQVIASFSQLNFHGKGGDFGEAKVDLKITDIKKAEFTVELHTWSQSKLWDASVTWLAHP